MFTDDEGCDLSGCLQMRWSMYLIDWVFTYEEGCDLSWCSQMMGGGGGGGGVFDCMLTGEGEGDLTG